MEVPLFFKRGSPLKPKILINSTQFSFERLGLVAIFLIGCAHKKRKEVDPIFKTRGVKKVGP
jgi:hypothetical protein